MVTAEEVIKDARHTLSDLGRERWTDGRLLSLLNDGLVDISKNTILYVREKYVELINNQTLYDLSSFAYKILRVEFEDKPLKQTSRNELDRINSTWQAETSEKITHYLVDKLQEGRMLVYPTPVNAVIDNINFGGSYGIITGVTYSDLQLNLGDTLGDLGEVKEDGFIKVFYIETPTTITDIISTINISVVAKEPLAHYIAGRALRDNHDAQNRSMGVEEINLYVKQLEDYSLEKAKNFSQVAYSVPYRPFGV